MDITQRMHTGVCLNRYVGVLISRDNNMKLMIKKQIDNLELYLDNIPKQ